MKKGFTLVELLVVIGILAILTAAVVVVLNPAELLRQSRDAQRLSDFDALRSAVNLYLSTAPTPTFKTGSDASSSVSMNTNCLAATSTTCYINTLTVNTGTGWVPIDFTELATSTVGLSAPISALPTDPINNASYHYAGMFQNANKYYVFNSVLESTKYNGKMSTDGGVSTTVYEVGNKFSW